MRVIESPEMVRVSVVVGSGIESRAVALARQWRQRPECSGSPAGPGLVPSNDRCRSGAFSKAGSWRPSVGGP